jgi:FkbM family methyltransferase
MTPKRLELPGRYYFHRLLGQMEYELLHLGELVPRRGRAIDVGANLGMYTFALAKLSTVVEAFEPQPTCADVIRAYRSPRINVHTMALGARDGDLTLSIPVRDGRLERSLATARITSADALRQVVPIKRLDDYEFADVTIIKIDVEGFESEVIEGAQSTICRERPLLLIEIEQRHLGTRSIESVFSRILSMGYHGSFFRRGRPVGIEEFSVEHDQNTLAMDVHSREYINNFIFRPKRDSTG